MAILAARDLKRVELALAQAAARWELSGPHQLLGNVENCVYELATPQGPRIVRLTEERHRRREQIAAELAFMDFLAARGIAAVAPFRSTAGELVETVALADTGERFHACVLEKAEGRAWSISQDATPAFFARLGTVIGQMHAAAVSYVPPAGTAARHTWREVDHFARGLEYITPDKRRARDELRELTAWLAQLPVEAGAFGHVHSDMHAGNFRITGETDALAIRAFDFDDAVQHHFAYDLAVPLFYFRGSFRREQLAPGLVARIEEAYLAAYAAAYPLPRRWLARVEAMVRLRAIELYAWAHKMLDLANATEAHARFLAYIESYWDDPAPLP
jgi:Ser/Thr protein kinase RdoA (MazF antagonist)